HGNTGSLAINLALILGAKRVFLLGFDMKLAPRDEATNRHGREHGLRHEGRANWHDVRYEAAQRDAYPRFMSQMVHIARSLPEVFPGCEIVNVTDDSNLNLFPKVSIRDHFSTK